MKVTISIDLTKEELQEAVAKGWNERFQEDLKAKDILSFEDKTDIILSIPYIDEDKIDFEVDYEI